MEAFSLRPLVGVQGHWIKYVAQGYADRWGCTGVQSRGPSTWEMTWISSSRYVWMFETRSGWEITQTSSDRHAVSTPVSRFRAKLHASGCRLTVQRVIFLSNHLQEKQTICIISFVRLWLKVLAQDFLSSTAVEFKKNKLKKTLKTTKLFINWSPLVSFVYPKHHMSFFFIYSLDRRRK